MKIFFVNYTDAGIHEPRGLKIASSLAGMGHEVVWVYCEDKGAGKIPGVKFQKILVPRVPFRLKELFFALKASRWIAKNHEREKFDVGIGFSHVGGLACYLAFRKTGLPFVFDYPDPLYPSDEAYASFYSRSDKWLAKIFEKIERKALNAASSVATISPYFKKFVHDKYGVPLENIFIASNAPDCSLFKPSGKKYGEFTIAYSGKGIPEYGLDWLLESFAKCKTSARLLLVVKTEPEWREWLHGEIRRLKLGRRIILRENVSPRKVSELVGKAHAAVFPYPRGKINDYAAPNKFFEYLALGLPVISRELPEAERILKEGKCGLIAKTGGEFCKGLKTLEESERRAREMGKNARKLALAKYDWRKTTRKYENKIKAAVRAGRL